ncbi:MAG: hypothetical protein IJR39_07100 [Treponema sp.]|nr:hypothetical protein [Treponema sp.]MBQ9623085.1 hypothetical protein [Treponema sp.]
MSERNWGGFRIGSGRKATGRSTTCVTLRLTKDEATTLKNRAASLDMTVSRFVAEVLHLSPPKKANELPESLTGNIRLSDRIV